MNTEEKSPMHSSPAQLRRSASGGLAKRRATKPIGVSSADSANTPSKSACSPANPPSPGAKRKPM